MNCTDLPPLMEKQMEQVRVLITEDGQVCIEQPCPYEDDDRIVLHPEQVLLLIEWLREAVDLAPNGGAGHGKGEG